jgi:hypothetical protein
MPQIPSLAAMPAIIGRREGQTHPISDGTEPVEAIEICDQTAI